jgi:rod shape-determining protein MreD
MMRWWPFGFALLAAYIVQATLVGWLKGTAYVFEWVDLLLMVALVVGLAAPVAEARLAGWITGLAADFQSVGPMGLYAFAFGLAVYVLTLLREQVNRELWWVRWLAGFIVALPAVLLVRMHERIYQGLLGLSAWRIVELSVMGAAIAALGAALVLALPATARWRTRRSW